MGELRISIKSPSVYALRGGSWPGLGGPERAGRVGSVTVGYAQKGGGLVSNSSVSAEVATP